MLATLAVLQSRPAPLVLLVVGQAAFGGTWLLRDPFTSPDGPRQYLRGALAVGLAVLVVVGIGHHPLSGSVAAVVLGATSPWLWRRVSGH